MLTDPNPAYAALGREGATSDPQVIAALRHHDRHQSDYLACLAAEQYRQGALVRGRELGWLLEE